MMVPTNLRSTADQQTPAANIVSMVNLDRRPIRYASPRRLLKSLSLEMAIIKRCRWASPCTTSSDSGAGSGNWHRCCPTTVVYPRVCSAIFGDVSAAVDSRLELVSLNFLPPVRPGTAAAFGISTLCGCTMITLHHDASLPAESARELLDKFVARLEHYCVDLPPVAITAPR